MDNFYAAIVAASAVLVTAWVTAFVSEDYRRFRTGKALAAALAGELSSYLLALEIAKKSFSILLENAEKGIDFSMPKIDAPVDNIFEANVADLGLLGGNLAGQVPFVYHQVKTFRSIAMSIREAPNLAQKTVSLRVCLQLLANCETHGRPIASELKLRATMTYRPFMD